MAEASSEKASSSHVSARAPKLTRAGQLRYRAAAIVAVTGLVLTGGLVSLGHLRDEQRAKEAFDGQARHVAFALRTGFSLATSAVHALPPLFDAGGAESEKAFRAFTQPLLRRNPSIAFLEYATYVPAEKRIAFEARMQKEGHPDFVIRQPDATGRFARVPERPLYFPISYLEPPSPMAFGLDVAFEPGRRRDIDSALDHPDGVASERFTLAEDAPGVSSVAVYMPVFALDRDLSSSAARRAALEGLAIEVFRLRPVVERALATMTEAPVDVVLLDEDAAPSARVLFETTPGQAARLSQAGLALTNRFEFQNRHWESHVLPRIPAEAFGPGAWGALVVGLLVTAAASVAAGALGGMKRLQRAVAEARQYGQYRLVRKLGEGGMGTVYEASHALLRRPTALKLLRTDVTADLLARFEKEVRFTAKLTHPNTVAVYDYGHTPAGVFYYAMEYLEGVNLEDLVHEDGPQPPARVAHIIRQVLGSLAEAHAAGLVHRDIKPSNVMLCVRGGIFDFVKVLDFGLVKETSGDTPKLSLAGQLLGTPHYMAPEALASAGAVGPSADLYAVGAVTYFLLTGRDVFEGEPMQLLVKHMTESPERPSLHVKAPLPERLEALVLACLEKDPAARPASAVELARALDDCGAGHWSSDEAKAWWQTRGSLVPKPDDSERVSAVAPTVQVDVAGRFVSQPPARPS